MTADDRPGVRIAEAVERLRHREVVVEVTTQAGVTTYLVQRPTYRAEIVVDPARWLGVEFFLLDENRVAELAYRVDTDLYNISLDKYRWFAVEIENDIVVLLDGLMEGRVFVDRTSPRPSLIVPSSDGPLLIRRQRFGVTGSWYNGDVTSGPARLPELGSMTRGPGTEPGTKAARARLSPPRRVLANVLDQHVTAAVRDQTNQCQATEAG